MEKEIGLNEVEEIMKSIAERTLKREGTWVEGRRIKRYNRQLEELIKERRKLNKKRRKAEMDEEGGIMWNMHESKKKEIKEVVQRLMEEEEEMDFQR